MQSGIEWHIVGLGGAALLTMYITKCVILGAPELESLGQYLSDVLEGDGGDFIENAPSDFPAPGDKDLDPESQKAIDDALDNIDDGKEMLKNPDNDEYKEEIEKFIEIERAKVETIRSFGYPGSNGYH